MKLLFHYRNNNPIAISALEQQFQKYKITPGIHNTEDFPGDNKNSIYFFNSIKNGNMHMIKYLNKLGADIINGSYFCVTLLHYIWFVYLDISILKTILWNMETDILIIGRVCSLQRSRNLTLIIQGKKKLLIPHLFLSLVIFFY